VGGTTRLHVGVWLALLILLALTVGVTFAPLGPARLWLSLAIAAAKAGLIFWVYMHLREQGGLARVAATAAVAWLFILLLLSGADVTARHLDGGRQQPPAIAAPR
jgi:cytochrome c oxidase subunit 4